MGHHARLPARAPLRLFIGDVGPVDVHGDDGVPSPSRVRARTSQQRPGAAAWHLSISYFRWGTLLELQSFLYVPAHRFIRLTDSSHPYTCVSGSRDFYGRAYHGWLPAPCSGYANHPNRAIDGKGTRTPQVRQPCWLLRSLAFVSLIHI